MYHETEEKPILLNDTINIKTPAKLGELDDEIDKAVTNIPKETEPDGELDTTIKNVLKKNESEKITLEDAKSKYTPARHSDNTLLEELIDELNTTMKDFPKEKGVNKIFLRDQDLNCSSQEERELFVCQAEQELIKEVSGLPGAKFDHFRIDKKLMRNLNSKMILLGDEKLDTATENVPVKDVPKDRGKTNLAERAANELQEK
ncbi:interleukin 4 13A [Labeo rohita]|uniref:Interleukin 4 13A n=1 Tax=Labeo rohita TaxID=84645 RepID=A0A498N4G4_LABRO|nr:interleukin 4 13A [Labeo rohita]